MSFFGNPTTLGAAQGWQCPLCKTIYSPTVVCCWTCKASSVQTLPDTNPSIVSITTTSEVTPDGGIWVGRCDDCGLHGTLIEKGDHHGGTKRVCADRAACNKR